MPKLSLIILTLIICTAPLFGANAQDSSFKLPNSSLNLEGDPSEPTSPASQIEATGPTLPGSSGPRSIKLNLNALLWGRSVQDRFFHSSGALTFIDPRLEATVNSWLELDLQVAGYFVAGNSKSFFTQEGESSNLVFLEEAATNFKPIDHLQIRGGALYITLNPILSIMSQNTFMGTDQKYDLLLGDKLLTLTAYAMEGVPSSGTVTRGLIDDAPDAFFLSQTLEADVNLAAISTVIKLAGTHFEFGNLSSNIATDSQLVGNSVRSFSGIGPNNHFTIGFGGFETAGAFNTDWGRLFSSELTGAVIKNDEAPSATNWGTQFNLAVTTKFDKYNLTPSFGIFTMGADVTPATYTILPFRYQDRTGFTAMLKFELKKERINFWGSYNHGATINDNPYLADRDIYSLGMEAKYDIL